MSKEEYQIYRNSITYQAIDYEKYLEKIHKNHFSPHLHDNISLTAMQTLSDFHNYNKHKFLGNNDNENPTSKIEIPTEFNWAAQVPECFTIPIKDQKTCGSCYAFSSTYVLAKRMCLYDKKYYNLDLSPQEMISCDDRNSKCYATPLPIGWNYLENKGVSSESCNPFYSYIENNKEYFPKCSNKCDDYNQAYTKYRAVPNTLESTHTDEETQIEILKHGPVSSYLHAYGDLHYYYGGIYTPYKKIGGGGHGVSIIGWGYDERYGSYWIAANSWGPNWGEEGYFNIPFGVCEINKFSMASKPSNWGGKALN